MSDFVQTPQNDLRQLKQIITEYENYPSKGLTHGLQKDAIQNGFGARSSEKIKNALKSWAFTFELLKINGKTALTFWDEGTTGLTGDIVDVNEIEKMSANNKLTAEQNLSRFLSRFESGGNLGAGSFGRGKLIFQAASESHEIICDSLRSSDKEYIVFERKTEGTKLVQSKLPKRGKEAEEYIKKITGGTLKPLAKTGTRITILNLKKEVADSFKNAFKESDETANGNDLSKAIEETWWEIINFGFKIKLKYGEKTNIIKLRNPLKSIAQLEEDKAGYRIYHKKHIPVVVNDKTYKIKDLKFIVAPHVIDDDLKEIWIQRKRMKIGGISRRIDINYKINKKFCGYLILDPELEEIVLQAEGTTHYGFSLNKTGLIQITNTVKAHLSLFQQKLGIQMPSEEKVSQKAMLEALKEINEVAEDLGLLTDFAIGPESQDIELSISSFSLPNPGSKRVEFGQNIGPITFKIKNTTSDPKEIDFSFSVHQNNESLNIYNDKINLSGNEVTDIIVPSFIMGESGFQNKKAVICKASAKKPDSNEKMCKDASRTLWLGMEPPTPEEKPISIATFQPLFPHFNSRRVELTDAIQNIRFKIINNSPNDATLNIRLVVRKANKLTKDYKVLKTIIEKDQHIIKALSEEEFGVEQLIITNEEFNEFAEAELSPEARMCQIFFSLVASENIPELNINKADTIGTKAIPFYLGIDEKGKSIFIKTIFYPGDKSGERSKYDGDRASGYIFKLNTDHSSYKNMKNWGEDVSQYYYKEEMIKQAFIISVSEQRFKGIAENYKEKLTSEETPPHEAYETIDKIIGTALNRIENIL